MRRQFSKALRGAESSSCGETSKSRFRAPVGDRSTAHVRQQNRSSSPHVDGLGLQYDAPCLDQTGGYSSESRKSSDVKRLAFPGAAGRDFARWIDRCWRASFRVGFSILYVRRERVDPWGGNGRRKAAAADGGNEARAHLRAARKRRQSSQRHSLIERLEPRVVLNGAPVAVADPWYSTPVSTTLNVTTQGTTLVANDWDPESSAISASLVSEPEPRFGEQFPE